MSDPRQLSVADLTGRKAGYVASRSIKDPAEAGLIIGPRYYFCHTESM